MRVSKRTKKPFHVVAGRYSYPKQETPEIVPPGFTLADPPAPPTKALQQRVNEYGDTERQCTGCHDWMPETLEFFHRDKVGATGLSRRCRECRRPSMEDSRAKGANRRARALNLPGHVTDSDLQGLWVRQKGKCHWCGVKLDTADDFKFHVDHRVPLSRGGSNYPSNLVLSCPTCNNSKHAKMPDAFRANPVAP